MNEQLPLSAVKSPRTRREHRRRRILFALVIYSIAGFFIAPAIVKRQLLKRLPDLTHRQAAIKKVKVNPYALSLTVRGLSLIQTNGEPFAAFDELYINFQLSSIFRWAWTFSEIKLTHPTGNIVRDANGQFNFADLFSTNASPVLETNAPKSLPRVIVQHLVVTNGVMTITDQTRAKTFHTEYGPINLDLKDFTTRRDRNEPYSFVATTGDGERFAWSGKISVNPPRSTGKFALIGIPLKKYSPYVADIARIEISDGVLAVSASYRLDANATPIEFEVTNANVKLSNLEIKASDTNETLLALKDFGVTAASASLPAREARVPWLGVRGGTALVRRETDGQLNWLKLLVASTNQTAGNTAPWKAFLDQLETDNFNLSIEDLTTLAPAQLGLDDLRVNVKGLSNQTNAPVRALVDFNWRGGGAVRVEATGTLLPASVEANLAVTHLALSPIQSYVEQQARLVVNSGDLTVNGNAHFSPGAASLIQFTGDASISKFAAIDTVAYHDFAKWDELKLRGIQASLQTNTLNIEEIKFIKLETSLAVSSNGQVSVLALLPKKTVATASGETTNAASQTEVVAVNSFPIKVGALVFEKSSLRAADLSLTPRFNTSVEEFDGSIRDITFPGLKKAAVEIRGKVSAIAPFEITGAITPDIKNPFVDLTIAFTNTDLTPFDPYSGKFVGRPLNKGKLSLALHYNIEERKLKAENILMLDQLTFGARNQSTNATKLPVKLAVALLKDRNGRIDLNLPVTGSLDDPEFNIGGLVWKAMMNILTKVATSPFSLLGAMFGGGGEELQFVQFAPGLATLDDAQTNKLDKLGKALYERPALALEISGSVDLVVDRDALGQQKLHEKMKSLRIQQLTARGKSLPADFKFEEGDYEDLLRKTYKEEFNTTPERALREARVAAAATNTATRKTTASVALVELGKGATQLLSRAPKHKMQTTSAPSTSGTASARPRTEDELIRDELERRLITRFPASDEDLRDLIQRRTEAVRKFLLDSGKATVDQVFLTAPKPIDPAVNGESRATFSLD